MDPITASQALLQIYFMLMAQAGKTREERDELYFEAKAKYDALPDPKTLKDTFPEK